METLALVAPITCLEFFDDKFILIGEGPVLSVYSLFSRTKVAPSLTVLQHQRIHGIRQRRSTEESNYDPLKTAHSPSDPCFYDFAVFGGKAVRVVRLHQDSQRIEGNLCLETQGSLLELQDWILDARWLPGHQRCLLCVAVAHNSLLLVDIAAGRAVAQRSCLEGCLLYSALLLVHEAWTDTVLVGGTVFNQVVIWRNEGGDSIGESGHKAPVERRLLGHTGVVFSISYQSERGLLASASDDRSVRLWAVGALGGSGGNCGDLNPPCLRVLFGHQARVFAVHLSGGRVFSAGEDGVCLVWDSGGDGKVLRTLRGHRSGGVRALAVSGAGEEGIWVCTGGADGGVRLWKVENSVGKEHVSESGAEKLTDLKFPAHSLPKTVRILSWGHFVVCTDRGAVWHFCKGEWEMLWQGTDEFNSYCVMETVCVSGRGSAAAVHLCAVANISGSLQVIPVSHPQGSVRLFAGPGKIHTVVWIKETDRVLLLASGAEGTVYRWSVEVETDPGGYLVLRTCPRPALLLPLCAKRWLTAAVRLNNTGQGVLWVCGDRRGSLLLFQEREKEAGGGTEDPGESQEQLQPISCLFGVHGKHGVTSVCEYWGLFYSTGKDGCVRVFRVHIGGLSAPGGADGRTLGKEGRPELQVLRVQRACKGMEWLERVLVVPSEVGEEEEVSEESQAQSVTETTDGEALSENGGKSDGREAPFVLVGFQAAHFVVWDPVRRDRLLAVPCGGGHRSWGLWPSHTGAWPGHGALVFIKQGSVFTSEPPGEVLDESAGQTSGWDLRAGIHGRGIWCLCRLGAVQRETRWEIVVTGGEDTSVAVLALHPSSGAVSVLSVITDHISGVRAVAAVRHPLSGSGHSSLSALVVSAGGRAQIQCYRLLVSWEGQAQGPSCQVIQVAGHRLDQQWEKRRNRHKTVKVDPETKYVSVAVVEQRSGRVLLALTCSDGALRFFSVNEFKKQMEFLWETHHHQRCVLSVATCSLEDYHGNKYELLLSTATDGIIAVWHLTESLLAESSSGAAIPSAPCLRVPAHQSGVNSLAVWVERPLREDGGCLVTVASGGDDGQLTASTIEVRFPENGKAVGRGGFPGISGSWGSTEEPPPLPTLQLHLRSQIHVPQAHAAPVTALELLRPGLLVSTSSDQRVCLWRVSSSSVSHSGALCSHVADAAALAVWRGEEGSAISETGFETERVDVPPREQASRSQTRAEAAGEQGGRISAAEEAAAAQHKHEEPAAAVNETADPVYESRAEREEETSAGPQNTAQTQSPGEAAAHTSFKLCLKELPESSGTATHVGWVLVCGQGFQLLRVSGEETGPRGDMRRKNQHAEVTVQKQEIKQLFKDFRK